MALRVMLSGSRAFVALAQGIAQNARMRKNSGKQGDKEEEGLPLSAAHLSMYDNVAVVLGASLAMHNLEISFAFR